MYSNHITMGITHNGADIDFSVMYIKRVETNNNFINEKQGN